MIEMDIQVVGGKDLERAFDRAPKVVDEELRYAMEKSVLTLHGAVVENIHSGGTSILRNSVFHEIAGEGLDIEGTVAIDPGAAPYAIFVNEGTRPHFPPHEPIKWWVEKVIHPTDSDSVAWAIQQTIAKYGTEGQHFMEKAWDTTQADVDAFFQTAMERIHKRV